MGQSTNNPVEIDESFLAGKPKNMHRNRRKKLQLGMNGYAEKTAVFGMLERGTRQVRTQVIPNVKRATLQTAILNNVGFGATVNTDQYTGYDGLAAKQFIHETVNHMEEYVRGTGKYSSHRKFLESLKAWPELNVCSCGTDAP
jgi:hypothetical protein